MLSNLEAIVSCARNGRLVELIGDENLEERIGFWYATLRAEGRGTVVMEDHEQQYDPEKLALLIEKQTKDILKL